MADKAHNMTDEKLEEMERACSAYPLKTLTKQRFLNHLNRRMR